MLKPDARLLLPPLMENGHFHRKAWALFQLEAGMLFLWKTSLVVGSQSFATREAFYCLKLE